MSRIFFVSRLKEEEKEETVRGSSRIHFSSLHPMALHADDSFNYSLEGIRAVKGWKRGGMIQKYLERFVMRPFPFESR